ncbi:MAG: 50S ribosomal protein L22 [Candidatus Woesearchaeota archaeon]|nr:50S ribosomal protein L22 [Candidatus Woesearchaeota archaeon]
MKYSLKLQGNIAKAYGRDLSISTKKSVEICRNIKGMKLEKAKKYLEDVINMKRAVAMKRYIRDTAHKKGMASGRYPVKTAKEILKIIESAEENAKNQGLETKNMVVHILANKAARPWHFGRKRRQKMKRTHIQVVLQEKIYEKDERVQEKTLSHEREEKNKDKEEKK